MILHILRRKPKPKPDPLKAAQAEYVSAFHERNDALRRRDSRDFHHAQARLSDRLHALLQAEVRDGRVVR
ncbi:MAG: hypothetical protein ACK4Z5_12110 [Brevundimonas sp.]